MKKREIAQYIVDGFKPIVLATDFPAIEQCVDDAIRWYDRAGGDIKVTQVAYPGTNAFELPSYVDQVVNVTPDRVVSEIFTAQTLLLGVTILDYDIMTLALKQNHLADLRSFLASRMRWHWTKPYLYVAGMTTAVNNMVITYMPRYDWQDSDQDYTGRAEEHIIRYSRGLLKQKEGRILRMGTVIQAPLDGQSLYDEGVQEVKDTVRSCIDSRPVLQISRSF